MSNILTPNSPASVPAGRHAWQIVRQFTPNWFTVTMGTGILSLALNQAPFAALLPQNGGIDPETGKPIITMDVILTFFGQTLAGERVSGNTRLTLDFCFSCGGCS